MIENKQMRPNLIASFSGVSTGGLNSPISSSELAGMRAARISIHQSEATHRCLIANPTHISNQHRGD